MKKNKKNYLLYGARLAIFIVSTSFIIYGVQRGEAGIVLKKAIKICLECIGIG